MTPLRVARTAVAVLIPLLVVASVVSTLLSRSPDLLGTNRVPNHGVAVQLKSGQTVCHPQQAIPAGTTHVGVGVEVSGSSAVPLVFALRTKSIAKRQTKIAQPGASQVDFDVPAFTREVAAAVCLRSPVAAVGVEGIDGPYPNLVPRLSSEVRVDGKRVQAQLALTYFASGNPRLIDRIPQIMHRETIFRPSVIGTWLYWLILAAIPAIWFVTIRLLLKDASAEEDR